MPTNNKRVQTPIDSLKWLSMAACREEWERPILTYAYADTINNRTVTSDQYRLFIVNETLPNGDEQGLIRLPKSRDLQQYTRGFPDYNHTIPVRFNASFTVNANALKHALQLAMIFAKHSANKVRFALTDDSLMISAKCTELGDVTTRLSVVTENTTPHSGAYNGLFLLDALRGLYTHERDDMRISLNDAGFGWGYIALLENAASSHRQAIVMPMSEQR